MISQIDEHFLSAQNTSKHLQRNPESSVVVPGMFKLPEINIENDRPDRPQYSSKNVCQVTWNDGSARNPYAGFLKLSKSG